MNENKQDPAILREEARQRYTEAIKDFHASLLLAADRNQSVLEAFNRCCELGVNVIAVHWNDLDPNPLNNGRVTQWARGVGHNLNIKL